ncbi:unnamed protein product [Gongylonema pulchrum]|uniref:Uncharacterized protein n=1 Tax=Gongylonema pulchrum TaxID=637853 RepID=A0A3P6Q9U8_9BILA|nr:unnamed protein product [Gongylonema pulchrum]
MVQRETVMKTLLKLKIRKELLESIIRVGNKIDKLSELPDSEPGTYLVSCTDGRGLIELIAAVDKKVLSIRGATVRRLKLRPHSKAISYLLKHSYLVGRPTPSEDNNYLCCNIIMDDDEFSKFKANFSLSKRFVIYASSLHTMDYETSISEIVVVYFAIKQLI